MSHESSPGLCVTACVFEPVRDDSRIRAMVSIVLWNSLCIHGIKIIESTGRRYVAIPMDHRVDGSVRDLVHPITGEARRELETYILQAYERDSGLDGSGVTATLSPGPPDLRSPQDWPFEPA